MTKPKGSATFLQNDTEFLWFCVTCRETGIPASRRLGIKDEVLGLEIDNAVSLRLLRFDNESNAQQAKLLAYEVCKMAFGTKDDDVLDASELHELIRNDPYADENTILS